MSLGDRELPKNLPEMNWKGEKGYRHMGDHTGSDFVFQNSAKLCFNSFPIFREAVGVFGYLNTFGMYN